MNKRMGTALAGTTLAWCSLAAADLPAAFQNGTVNGNVRAHYQTWDFETRTDERAFALGGALRAETGPIGWARLGAGFYTAQDLDTNPDDPAKINRRLGSELEVLGEAYVSVTQWASTLIVGRQKIDTPFANPSDAFIVPITFEAMSLKSAAIPGVTLKLDYLNSFKNRNSDEFVDVGRWATSRYGVPVESTGGTLVVGALYKQGTIDLQGWYYQFQDLFDMVYLQAGVSAPLSETVKPSITLQLGRQRDSGDGLLGEIDAKLWGVQVGSGFGRASVAVAYNKVPGERDAFRNGAFLAPYSFSTSPILTNSMVETLENVDAGSATKLMLGYEFQTVSLKLSHAWLDFDTVVDRQATNFDITYSLDRYVKGFSLRWRVEVVTADDDGAEFTNHRLQAQYLF